MLPYLSTTQLHLGPITIQSWGLFVALGFVIGGTAAAWLTKRRGLKPEVVWDMLGWLLLSSMIFGRVFFVLFYYPGYFIERPLEVFAIWQGGMSMMGGLFGAALVAVIYFKVKKLNWFQYSDAMIFGLPIGYAIGRIGCFLIHDHPGIPTTFFLGVQYPDGIIRHDLGLYEIFVGLILFLVFLAWQKKARVGFFLATFLSGYGVARLLLDFLRLDDPRFAFLTAGQYFSLLLLVGGILIFVKSKKIKKV
ncbi:MAG: prolipoprotein diacylglyceryl transferase [Candidatus Uhrbacteria bacterium]